jgi:hypothetical protein
MSDTTYQNIQGGLSFLLLGVGAIALTFTIDYLQLVNALDLSIWGQTFMPSLITGAWVVAGLTLAAKVWGHLVNTKRIG